MPSSGLSALFMSPNQAATLGDVQRRTYAACGFFALRLLDPFYMSSYIVAKPTFFAIPK